MSFKKLTLASFAVLTLLGLSLMGSLANINDRQVLSDMQERGIYIPHSSEAVELPPSHPDASIPQALLEDLEDTNSEKGKV